MGVKSGCIVVRWTAKEDSKLYRMAREGFDWERIAAALPGRTVSACQQRVQYTNRKAAAIKKRGEYQAKPVEPVLPPPPAVQSVAGPYGSRRVSTHVLIIDNELRSRIALQGLTAGLLGDPLPGRSALDQRNAERRA